MTAHVKRPTPIVILVTLAALAGPATADTPPQSKKARMLAAKAARNAALTEAEKKSREKKLARRVGKSPEEVVSIFNLWTEEILPLALPATKTDKAEISAAIVNRFFRCHYTGHPTEMDPKLIWVLGQAARRFDSQRINIISGFRSPKYNLNLRKKGHEVARNSQHTHGAAVDFRIPGVPTRRLRRWARGLKLGGVGYYPQSRFIHVDTADVRYWTGR